ncbi:UNKNOWN [Stylonychia lemnae]|uniref:Ubiquitin-like domain-containing protein n=1 Tax=Stylonychia lemnae TaxID=5949 RepID=A0A077ZTL3_STYLE|nr:UNKNOWN [Stylonychia lemnae]|eukprot:CDW72675.1 UNKNOWN [Stylonychia lemnae]
MVENNNYNSNGNQMNLKVILVHYPGAPIQLSFDKSSTVKQLKDYLLRDKWPQNYTDVQTIEKLRFFYQGKELQDSSFLSLVGFITETKNEEGIVEKLVPGILVHTVKKNQGASQQSPNKEMQSQQKSKQRNPENTENSSCNCRIF